MTHALSWQKQFFGSFLITQIIKYQLCIKIDLKRAEHKDNMIVGDLLAGTILIGCALAVSDKGVAVDDTLQSSYLTLDEYDRFFL